jgi:flagellar hook-associated protein 1
MSGLFATLHSSAQALSAHSRSIEIAGKNLANVNNASYARQRVVYGDRGTVVTAQGAESLGIEAMGIQQLRDALLDRQLMREIGLRASALAEQSGYQRAQAALGQSIHRTGSSDTAAATSSSGLAAALDDFFNACQSVAASPTDQGERQMLLQKAAILSDRFQFADQRLARVQEDLGAGIAADVGAVNRLIKSVAELNAQIARFEVNAPGSAVDLRDQRQARLEELSALLPIEIRDSGPTYVQVVARDSTGNDILLVDATSAFGPVVFDGRQVTLGDPPVALSLTAGSIGGSLTARDGAIQAARDELDALARQLVAGVNEAYDVEGTGQEFFAAGGTTAGKIALRPGLTAENLRAGEGSAAGDNRVVLAMAALAQKSFSIAAGDAVDGTITQSFSRTVSRLGQALAGSNARVEDQSAIERLVRTQRDSVSGTSMDEEVADLMKYQRAFQASSRVFNVMDELLDLVVNRLGRG